MSQAPAQEKVYTEEDYYNLPEDVRAELIDGRIYYQAAPSRQHQTILSEIKKRILPCISCAFRRQIIRRPEKHCGTGYQCDL